MRALRAGQAFDGERFIGPVDVVLDGGDIVEVSPWREHGGDVALEDLGDATRPAGTRRRAPAPQLGLLDGAARLAPGQ